MSLDANERLATETMMGKAMTVTDSKTLWGEGPEKKSMFFFYLFELLSFQSAVLPAFTVLTYFCLDNKNNAQGGGGGGELPYKPIWDMPFFRVSFFSINS